MLEFGILRRRCPFGTACLRFRFLNPFGVLFMPERRLPVGFRMLSHFDSFTPTVDFAADSKKTPKRVSVKKP